MRFILDDGPFGPLAKVVETGQTREWRAGHFLVAEATDRAARRDARRAHLLEMVDGAGHRIFETLAIKADPNDPAWGVLLETHSVRSDKNLAERQSIAWALTHGHDAIFAAADKLAAFTALAELGGGRVAHPFDVWLDLLDKQWIDREQFQRLCKATRKGDQSLERMPGRITERLDPA